MFESILCTNICPVIFTKFLKLISYFALLLQMFSVHFFQICQRCRQLTCNFFYLECFFPTYNCVLLRRLFKFYFLNATSPLYFYLYFFSVTNVSFTFYMLLSFCFVLLFFYYMSFPLECW